MENIEIAEEWFDIAAMDLSSADYLQTMHPVPLEIICYHCQQSSEKYLKGYLALNNHEVIKTHDLMLLNNLCREYDDEFEVLEEVCLRLTDYGVNIRYPYPIDLNIEDMILALEDAKRVKVFVENKYSLYKGKKSEEETDEE